MMNSFIYDDGGDHLNITDGKLSFSPIQDQWKQGLEYIHGLFSKGLITTAALTQTNDVLNKQAINHEVGVVPWGCMNCVVGAEHMSDIVNWGNHSSIKGYRRRKLCCIWRQWCKWCCVHDYEKAKENENIG